MLKFNYISYIIRLYIKILFLFNYAILKIINNLNIFFNFSKLNNLNIILKYAIIKKIWHILIFKLFNNIDFRELRMYYRLYLIYKLKKLRVMFYCKLNELDHFAYVFLVKFFLIFFNIYKILKKKYEKKSFYKKRVFSLYKKFINFLYELYEYLVSFFLFLIFIVKLYIYTVYEFALKVYFKNKAYFFYFFILIYIIESFIFIIKKCKKRLKFGRF